MPNFNRSKVNELFFSMNDITSWTIFWHLYFFITMLSCYVFMKSYVTTSQQDISIVFSAYAAVNRMDVNPICTYCHEYEKKQQ